MTTLAHGPIVPVYQWFDDTTGAPLAGGKVYTYASGTTTPQATYNNADLAGGHQNTNPIILDASGKCVIYVGELNYTFDVQTSLGVSLDGYPRDNIVGLTPSSLSAVTVAQGGTGNTSLTAHAVLLGEGTSPVGFAAPSVAGHVLTDNGAAADPSFQALSTLLGAFTLLHQGAGSSTAAGATTVDSVALASGLTNHDCLLVLVKADLVGGFGTVSPLLYNVTDGVSMVTLDTQNANYWFEIAFVASTPNSLLNVISTSQRLATVTAARSVFVTNYTGNWSLGLRHGGVAGGDTWYYDWTVYKLAGQ